MEEGLAPGTRFSEPQYDRRDIFMRYLKEVATAVHELNGVDRDDLYGQLVTVAKRVTADADMKLDDRGRKIVDSHTELDFGENVLIVDPVSHAASVKRAPVTAAESD